MRRLCLSVITVLFLVVAQVRADNFQCIAKVPTGEYQNIIEEIEDEYDDITNFSAQFIQKSYFLGLDRSEYSKGEVFFKKSGKMKWNYQTPETQLFIADGQSVWFYQPNLKQVTIGDFESSFRSDMPVSFLLGLGSIRDKFFIQDICKTDHGIKVILKPKQSDGNLETFQILVGTNSYLPLGAQIEDFGGNETTIGFSNIDTDQELSDTIFSFNIPRGVDVIDNRGPKNNLHTIKGSVKEENLFEPVTREQLKKNVTTAKTQAKNIKTQESQIPKNSH